MASFDIFNTQDDILNFKLIEALIDRLGEHDYLVTLHFDGYSVITVKVKNTGHRERTHIFAIANMDSQESKQNTLNMIYYYLAGICDGIQHERNRD